MLLLTTLACLPNLTEHDRPEEGALAIDAVALWARGETPPNRWAG